MTDKTEKIENENDNKNMEAIVRKWLEEKFMPDNDVAWIKDENKLAKYLGGEYTWVYFTKDAIKNTTPILRSTVGWDTFMKFLEESNRLGHRRLLIPKAAAICSQPNENNTLAAATV